MTQGTRAMKQPVTPTTPQGSVLHLLRNLIVVALIALLAIMGFNYYRAATGQVAHSKRLATSTVTIVSATTQEDGVHVRAHLDAPSPDGTSHTLEGVIPKQTWALTRTLWACYPPKSPDSGFLRTPLDPACPDVQHD